MPLILAGVSHKTAPVELRERVSVSERDVETALDALLRNDGVRGAALLSTCNRVEIVASAESELDGEFLTRFLADRAGVATTEAERFIYLRRDGDVIRHLFRVAAGLDSMIVGEPQIQGQVKEAHRRALEHGTLDTPLQKLLEQTLRVAKRIRTETGIGEHAASVPFAAVELARKIFGELTGLKILLIGAGEMGELTAENLRGQGLDTVFVANRAQERAEALARRFDGRVVDFQHLRPHLVTCDIVVVSTAAPHFVIGRDEVHEAMSARRRRDLFLIDLSVPRNIDPEVATVKGAYLYDIDDLQQVVDDNLRRRLEKAEAAETIIEEETEMFLRRLASHDAVPTILELRARMEEIRAAELEKCLRRMGPVTAEQQQAIEALTNSIINKILHYPIVQLRETAADHPPDQLETFRETIRKIFGL